MRNVSTVSDFDFGEIQSRSYDLAIFASGYERRCRYIPKLVSSAKIKQVLVLGFSGLADHDERRHNDAFYFGLFDVVPKILSGDDDGPLFSMLEQYLVSDGTPFRILVDYTSMSRLWYAALLNWSRFRPGKTEIFIDFVYAFGRYDQRADLVVIRDILPIPGCEGVSTASETSVAVLGLGFDSLATLCLLDKAEPDLIYSFYASPAKVAGYVEKVTQLNKEVLDASAVAVGLPPDSVEQTFRYLVELVKPHRGKDAITIIPMGIKPHVLASILISFLFPEVSCLRVSSARTAPDEVDATGDVTSTEVILRQANEP